MGVQGDPEPTGQEGGAPRGFGAASPKAPKAKGEKGRALSESRFGCRRRQRGRLVQLQVVASGSLTFIHPLRLTTGVLTREDAENDRRSGLLARGSAWKQLSGNNPDLKSRGWLPTPAASFSAQLWAGAFYSKRSRVSSSGLREDCHLQAQASLSRVEGIFFCCPNAASLQKTKLRFATPSRGGSFWSSILQALSATDDSSRRLLHLLKWASTESSAFVGTR